MRQVIPPGPLVGPVAVLALLAVLQAVSTDGLGVAGWAAGLACAAALGGLLGMGLRRAGRRHLTPADRVTLTRAVLACGVAALVAAGVSGTTVSTAVLVAFASVALVLDAVDGRVARRTGTVHPFGARFDMESDAFLILVLGVHVAGSLGWWVLVTGAARYLLLLVTVAARWAPWLRGQVPARLWRKVVAAYQGIALTAVSAGILSQALATVVAAAGLGLLVVSFGTEVATLRRGSVTQRTYAVRPVPSPPALPSAVVTDLASAPVATALDVRALP
ncbi:CDP-alcohol phosphatidyltransferase family protein [Terrabacter sp. C0L_2]|uniref:CDP-alcohol phosphatidyltransferase family protein n=1 Tax=Terrabacter sp. C0L_2 TaxID=3108389 RepID=UPI002ED5497F|nr:CDP-alcohol phosphatidyltransferase family protein [Terrabacter sp. C0L_2]